MLRPLRRAEIGFTFIREIGQHGKNSRTFVAKDPQLDAEIVIKEISKSKLDRNRFFAEAQALYASTHPFVVQIHYACEDNDSVYVAMPLYRNGSLKDVLQQRFLTVREIVAVGCEVLAGLQHVHSKRLVHFDVKPDNVLLSERGEGLLSDFGLARPVSSRGVAEQDVHYLKIQPPEAYSGYEFPRTFDIYQAGLLLYRMCNGEVEFYRQFDRYRPGGVFDRNAFRVAVVNGQFPDRSVFPAHIPERLRSVVRKCLETDPAQRFGSALQVANALALIDGPTLDWQLSIQPGCQRWEKNVEGTLLEFEWTAGGSTTCYKTKSAGQRRRFGAGCTDRMTDRQVRSFLGEH
jgi:eukaryotic-like serine/threonine-protein kinase